MSSLRELWPLLREEDRAWVQTMLAMAGIDVREHLLAGASVYGLTAAVWDKEVAQMHRRGLPLQGVITPGYSGVGSSLTPGTSTSD